MQAGSQSEKQTVSKERRKRERDRDRGRERGRGRGRQAEAGRQAGRQAGRDSIPVFSSRPLFFPFFILSKRERKIACLCLYRVMGPFCAVARKREEEEKRTKDQSAIFLRQELIDSCLFYDHLVGLVVKASASRAEDPGSESRLRRDFCGSSHTSDLKIGTPVAAQPGAWRYRVSAGTGRPGVSIL